MEKLTLRKGWIFMKNLGKFIMVILCLMCAALLVTSVVSADKVTEEDVVIPEDSYEDVFWLLVYEDDKVDVSVTVDSPSGGLVDVYILSSSEWFDYPDEPFTPELSKESVSTTSFTFTAPEAGSYYLIIDNVDNSRSNDAIPTGSVTVDYEYEDVLAEKVEEAFWTGMWICIVGIIIIVVVIIVIIVVVLKISSKGGPPQQPPQYQQQYPPPQQPPYQQYPQQPYQPPPQQPPQQPPPGQPPQ
jgi:hypothetical protein